jgi:hypothetical protein
MFMPALLTCLMSTSEAQDVVRIGGAQAAGGPAVPDQYVIQQGDTLWDISSKFLGNPDNWPRLWSINEQITNPHWIYPGNRIVFVPGSVVEPPSMSLEPGESFTRDGYVPQQVTFEEGELECGPDVRFTQHIDSARYRVNGLMEDGEPVDFVGQVYKARTEALAQGEHDLLYLRLEDPSYADCGDVVTILHREKRAIRHPEGGARYGALYRVAAEARILFIQGDIATAVVRRAWSEVLRGDFVTVRVPTAVETEVEPPKGSLEGVIVARLNQNEANLSAIDEVVFIDRGRADGVRVGSSFFVVERRDGYLDRDEDDPDLPASVMGRLVVVRVEENSSAAVVVQAARSVGIGLHVMQSVE